MDTEGDHADQAPRRTAQVDNAIRAIQEKKPLPEIDFTIHMMEDGTQVSTLERVCKGTSVLQPMFYRRRLPLNYPAIVVDKGRLPSGFSTASRTMSQMVSLTLVALPLYRCPGAGHVQAHG